MLSIRYYVSQIGYEILIFKIRQNLPATRGKILFTPTDRFASCTAVPVQAQSKAPCKPKLLWHAARQGLFKARVGVGQDFVQQRRIAVDIGGAREREGTGCGKRKEAGENQ